MRKRLRRWANAAIVTPGLLLALPAVAIAERARQGSGRRVAVLAIRSITRACGVRIRASGPEVATGVLVANHASLLDPPALLLGLDEQGGLGVNVRFVATAGLFRIPVLAGALRALGTIAIDRRHPSVARRQLAELAASQPGPVVVFAQGAIPKPGGDHLAFKSGAFALAIELGVPVVPVAITGTGDVLPRGRRFTIGPGAVGVHVLDPIDSAGVHRRVLRDRTEAVVRTVTDGVRA